MELQLNRIFVIIAFILAVGYPLFLLFNLLKFYILFYFIQIITISFVLSPIISNIK